MAKKDEKRELIKTQEADSIFLFELNVYKTNQYYDSTKDYYFIDPANFFHFFSCLEPKYIK